MLIPISCLAQLISLCFTSFGKLSRIPSFVTCLHAHPPPTQCLLTTASISPLGVNQHLISKENHSLFVSVWKFLASIKLNRARINSPLLFLSETRHLPYTHAPPPIAFENKLFFTHRLILGVLLWNPHLCWPS